MNYGNISNNIATNVNLYSQNVIDLTFTNHALKWKWIICGDRVASLVSIILSLLGCLFGVLFTLLWNKSSILFPSNKQLQLIVELVMIYFMFTVTR